MAKRSAGLIVVTRLPGGRLVAVLAKRGMFNLEKPGLEPYPGICQVTCHGGLKEGESYKDGMLREAEEELGGEFALNISCLADCTPTRLIEIDHSEKANEEVVTFATEIEFSALKRIRLHPSSGGLFFIFLEDTSEVMLAQASDKVIGFSNSRAVMMFPDELGVVKKALEHFSAQQ